MRQRGREKIEPTANLPTTSEKCRLNEEGDMSCTLLDVKYAKRLQPYEIFLKKNTAEGLIAFALGF
jgi:hypothetical protein